MALAKQVAAEYTEKDVIRAHARDELGIDMDNLTNPTQVGIQHSATPLCRMKFIRPARFTCSKSYNIAPGNPEPKP